ncbi:MAG: TraU family protein [Sutterellaceae bacterium]|nr:TraU family protein [Sutterellaceae bacterium]
MLSNKLKRIGLVLASTLCLATSTFAQDAGGGTTGGLGDTGASTDGQTQEGGPGCQDAKALGGKLITGVCWDCVFPILVSNVPIGDGDKVPPGVEEYNKLGTCMCYDNLGVPTFGFRLSMWEPARMVELQRQSGCSSVLGGIRFPFNKLNQGKQQRLSEEPITGTDGKSFRHYHFYTFPLMYMMNMWVPNRCNPGGFMDLDIMYLSEIDPTWSNDEIAFFTHPEAALIASPLGPIACIPDVFGANIGKPIKELYWCAGSWGVIYPTSGNVLRAEGTLKSTSLMSTRVLYALHRRGLEYRSIGEDAMCGGQLSTYLPKHQYRFQVFHPIAETDDNHVIGEMTFTWGLGRTIPAVGEDPVYIIWRWLDCCNTNA